MRKLKVALIGCKFNLKTRNSEGKLNNEKSFGDIIKTKAVWLLNFLPHLISHRLNETSNQYKREQKARMEKFMSESCHTPLVFFIP